MELKYCDKCGAIQNEPIGENVSPATPYLCRTCRGDPSEPGEASADEHVLSLFDAPSQGEASDEELRDELDLFSARSLAMKREDMARATPSTTSEAVTREKTVPFNLPPEESLDLFSAQTVAMRKKSMGGGSRSSGSGGKRPGSSRVIERRPESVELVADKPSPTGAKFGGSGSGSLAPAGSATRLQFRCVHCRAKLMIKPVKRLSKMVCPRCSNPMYIAANGQVSKEPPPRQRAGSVRAGSGSRAAPGGGSPLRDQAPPRPDTASSGSRAGDDTFRPNGLPSPSGSSELSSLVQGTHEVPGPAAETSPDGPTAATGEARGPAPLARPAPGQPATVPAPASESEFLQGLLSDLSPDPDLAVSPLPTPASAGSPAPTPAREAAHGPAATPGEFRLAPSGPLAYVCAVIFGLIVASPLLVTTLLVDGIRSDPAQRSRLQSAVASGLDSLGGAVQRAYESLYDKFAD